MIDLINPVDINGRLYLNFTNDWTFRSKNCTIVSGFNLKPNNEPISCRLIEDNYAYIIDNF